MKEEGRRGWTDRERERERERESDLVSLSSIRF